MNPTEIKKDIFWVGAVDWNLRDFHGYSTEKGSSYNAYLVKDKKTVLFDTVKYDFTDELLKNISQITDPETIDYIVVNHAEMDHTGALPEIIRIAKPEKVICNAKCKDTLIEHFHDDSWQFEIIKEGDEIEIGSRKIRFYDSKMLHWPESMVSYIEADKLLISNDIFGQHWATSERFADQVDQGELSWQNAKYYANIFLPFSPAAGKFLKKLQDNNLEIDMIAPDHGLIWRKDIDDLMKTYTKWTSQSSDKKAVVAYGSMWGSTHKMAEAICKGISSQDVVVKMMSLNTNHRSDIITEILEARAVILGSSVMNNGILPTVGDLLTYIKGLKPSNKLGASFGSYGWANKGVKILNEALQDMKFEIINDGISVKYVPTVEDLEACENFGKEIGKAIHKNE